MYCLQRWGQSNCDNTNITTEQEKKAGAGEKVGQWKRLCQRNQNHNIHYMKIHDYNIDYDIICAHHGGFKIQNCLLGTKLPTSRHVMANHYLNAWFNIVTENFICKQIMYMSSLNMLPSAPSEKLYPELLSGNFWLSRIDDIEKQISEESRTTEKSPKDTRKHWPPCATPPSVWAFSRPLSQPLALPWALHALESLLAPLLVLLEHFVVLDLLCLQTSAKNSAWKFQNTKEFTHCQTQFH